MNKPVYLCLSTLKIRNIVMYEFCYDYVNPKCNEKVKSCYMDTYSLIVCIKAEHNVINVEERFDISNYPKSLLKGKNTKNLLA